MSENTKRKPIIGISSSLIIDKGGPFPGLKRAYVNKSYVDSVLISGGIPMIIPFTEDENIIKAQIEIVDGLILSGGHDIFPLNYGEEPKQRIGEVFPERDLYDATLLFEAKKREIPILGICRGIQVINVFEGGTLYQDLSYINGSELKNNNTNGEILKHSQGHDFDMKTHTVFVEKNSKLFDIFGEEEIFTNSFHHQALKDISPDYRVTARAKDGVIEAIEHKTYPFLVGVQWHPEALSKNYEDMKNLFVSFIKECVK